MLRSGYEIERGGHRGAAVAVEERRSPRDLLPLICLAGRNDSGAQTILVRELYAPVFRYLRRWLGDRPHADELAKDLTQDTLLQVLRCVAACEAQSEGEFLAWVLKVARNCARMYLRRRREELARLAYPQDLDVATHRVAYQEWARGDTEHTLAFSVLLRLAQSAGNTLSEETQRLLWQRLVEGAPWNEIAEALGTTYRAAQRRFQRAQGALRRQILERVGDLPEPERSAVTAQLTWFNLRGTER
jgi:RNA polymerase sigma factor (sigma-70 family)